MKAAPGGGGAERNLFHQGRGKGEQGSRRHRLDPVRPARLSGINGARRGRQAFLFSELSGPDRYASRRNRTCGLHRGVPAPTGLNSIPIDKKRLSGLAPGRFLLGLPPGHHLFHGFSGRSRRGRSSLLYRPNSSRNRRLLLRFLGHRYLLDLDFLAFFPAFFFEAFLAIDFFALFTTFLAASWPNASALWTLC